MSKSQRLISPQLYQLLVQATSLFSSGELKQAEQLFRELLSQDPKNPDANHYMGIILNRFEQNDLALKYLQKAVKVSPKISQIHNNLGVVQKALGQLTKASQSINKAIYLSPNNGSAYNNLAGVYQDQGKLLEADEAYAKSIKHGFFPAFSNRLLLTNYRTDMSSEDIKKLHEGWGEFYSSHHAVSLKEGKARRANSRIKIGYLSPDFNSHSVSYFFEALLDHVDSSRFEIFCYYASSRIDETTLRFQKKANKWRSIVKLNDKQAADLVSQDDIDILIDMSGHTGQNRLGVFTYQAAPIQMTWLGYPNTTGIQTIQYRLVDDITDPSDSSECCTEELIRLPNGFLCYQGNDELSVNPVSAASRNGYFTFGSFNNLRKVNEHVISAWAQILRSVPDSRLLIKSKQFAYTEVKKRIQQLFKSEDISANRLILMDRVESQDDHLKLYEQVDLALDTFPYNGTTTTCEALWMGVPTVTFKGDCHAARVSASILHFAGLDEYIANDLADYIGRAVDVAQNHQQLTEFRETIRDKLKASPLCDAEGFTRSMENAYTEALSKGN